MAAFIPVIRQSFRTANHLVCSTYTTRHRLSTLSEALHERQLTFHDYRDYVLVEDLVLHGYHGDIPHEKETGQKFEFCIKLFPPQTRLDSVAKSDLLSDTLDYVVIVKEIESMMQSTAYNMIETLGHEIAKRAFDVYGKQQLQAIQIQIRKPQVPITQHVKCTGVNIFRTATDFVQ